MVGELKNNPSPKHIPGMGCKLEVYLDSKSLLFVLENILIGTHTPIRVPIGLLDKICKILEVLRFNSLQKTLNSIESGKRIWRYVLPL